MPYAISKVIATLCPNAVCTRSLSEAQSTLVLLPFLSEKKFIIQSDFLNYSFKYIITEIEIEYYLLRTLDMQRLFRQMKVV